MRSRTEQTGFMKSAECIVYLSCIYRISIVYLSCIYRVCRLRKGCEDTVYCEGEVFEGMRCLRGCGA